MRNDRIPRAAGPVLFSLCAASIGGCSSSSGDAQPHAAGTGGVAGVADTGGVVGSGGAINSAGAGGVAGVADTGGVVGSGGATNSGGVTRSGGRTSVGGASGSGGTRGGGGATTKGGAGGAGASGSTAAGGASGGATGTGGATGAGGSAGATGAGGASGCIGAAFLSALGKNTVLIGGSLTDATAAKAPFDGRYLYLSGGLFDGAGPCASCASGCTTGGTSCSNSAGCAWWGCWQYDQDPPGQYVVSFVSSNEKASPKQIPMFTYYQELQASGLNEGTTQVAALNDATFLTRYLADWRFVLQKIGTHVALLHIEPDFWGYVEQLNADPHAVPAKVASANPTDCAGYENSAAGFAKCMIHMVRVYAPSAKVGVHASAWGTNFDVFGNSSAKLDVAGEAQKMATFLTALGAPDGDFIVSDPSDRDAGYYQSVGRNTWWDASNASLPNFHQAFTWTKALAEAMNLPIVLWQIPVGNMSQNNTTDHWQDNRLDYFFAHMDEVVAAHVVGLFFGAGAGGMTTPETDGGNLVAKTNAYRTAGGAKVCN